MNKQSLPVVDSARTEFGFYRTHCDCPECTRSCHHIPGYLVPTDLERFHRHLDSDQDLLSWAKQNLLGSPGALVAQNGQMFRIPTLVPARRFDGACVFLTDAGQCSIHAVSPYGCAFFDSHLALPEADRRSKRGLQAVVDAWNAGDVYAHLWLALAADGLRLHCDAIGIHEGEILLLSVVGPETSVKALTAGGTSLSGSAPRETASAKSSVIRPLPI